MQLPKSNLSELQLLRKEIETLGDDFDRERLDLRGEIDKLKVELRSLQSALKQLQPEFQRVYEKAYADELQSFDPETERERGTGLKKTG